MESITIILKVIGALFCCIMVFVAGCLVAHIGMLWGKREIARENEYNERYKEIRDRIKFCTVNPDTYKYLLGELSKLKKLKHKDRKKTSDLLNEFYWKYRTIAKQRANEPCKQYSKVEL